MYYKQSTDDLKNTGGCVEVICKYTPFYIKDWSMPGSWHKQESCNQPFTDTDKLREGTATGTVFALKNTVATKPT